MVERVPLLSINYYYYYYFVFLFFCFFGLGGFKLGVYRESKGDGGRGLGGGERPRS